MSMKFPDIMNADRISAMTDALIESYALEDAVDRVSLPAVEAITAVLEETRRLLFPGYYSDEPLPQASCRFKVGTWLCKLYADLGAIILRARAHVDPITERDVLHQQSLQISARFVEALPTLRRQLQLDAQAALAGDPAAGNLDEIILTYPGFQAITVYRIAHWLQAAGVPYVPRAMSEHAHARTGIDIHPGARIGARFFIDHGTGVVIGETTDIGDDVKIYQGVTLGALSVRRSLAGSKRHPTLEDGAILYAGATVLGGKTVIGRNAIIGGNVWLTESVPPDTTVIESDPKLDFRARPKR